MTGLRTALACAPSPCLFVVSGDMPLVTPPVVTLLASKCDGGNNVDAIIPRWGNGYLEPTLALYKVAAMKHAVETCIEAGQFQVVQAVWKLDNVVHVPVQEIRQVDPDLACMVNVNDPSDLDDMLASRRRGKR